MTYQDMQFANYAGQLIAGGIGTNLPIKALEEGTVTSLNIDAINGLSAKIKDVFIHETKVFNNPIDPYVRKYDSRFGAGMEQAVFKTNAANAKLDGTCMPWGNVEMVSQMNLTNFAYDVDVSIRDHEVDKAVLDEGQLGAYVANKLRTPLATIAQLKYRAWVELISDVTSGVRSVSSHINSNDTTSTSVTYNPTITGYAGAVEQTSYKIPAVARGSKVIVPDAPTALGIAQDLEARAADMKYQADDMNALGAQTFTTGTPLLIMEEKVLNGLDAVFANVNAAGTGTGYGYAGFPTKSFREFVSRFSEIVEIDSFAALPTNAAYDSNRLGAVLMDRDALVEKIEYADVESFRCTKERATGYSYQGSSTMSIWKGDNSYAMLFDTSGA